MVLSIRSACSRQLGLWLSLFFAVGVQVAGAQVNEGKPQILVSIKPLALIAQAVAGDLAQVDTLLPVTASPHDYPLKMSDHRRLRAADLFVWVGPELESFLAKPVTNLEPGHVLEVFELPGMEFPPAVEPKADDDDDDHHHGGRDPHLWLNPGNARLLAQSLAARLAQLDPVNSAQYFKHATEFAQRLAQLDKQLRARLAPLAGRGFGVSHQGYTHFVAHYGLRQLAYINLTPERHAGARHLAQLRQKLKSEGAVCLFTEPFQQGASVTTLTKELQLRTGELDPIGIQASSYEQLLDNLSESFVACLGS